MGLDRQSVTQEASSFDLSSTDQLAASVNKNPDVTQEELTESVSAIVTAMLDEQWAIVRWLIDEAWVARLVASIVDSVGNTVLKWLN